MPQSQEMATERRPGPRPGPLWWIRQLLLTGIAVFFVGFGIGLLRAAYGLNDPYSFIMTFFAASLMILISCVMVLAFVVRMRLAGRRRPDKDDPAAGQDLSL